MDIPLGLAGHHELINHDLGPVCKVTKLRFPERKGVRLALSVTVFETEDSVLGEMRARGDEFSAGVLDSLVLGLQDWAVTAIAVLVEDVSVSVRESTSFHILTGEAHVVAVIDESGEGKSLGTAPVDTLLVVDGLQAVFVDLYDVVVELAVSGQRRDFLSNLCQFLLLNTGERGEVALANFLPLLGGPLLLGNLQILRFKVGGFHLGTAGVLNLFEVFLLNALAEQLGAEQVAARRVLGDDLVHQGLSEGWLIQLVVAELAVANEVDHDIAAEFLAELCRESEGTLHVGHAVSVHVEDGRVDGLCDVGGILA